MTYCMTSPLHQVFAAEAMLMIASILHLGRSGIPKKVYSVVVYSLINMSCLLSKLPRMMQRECQCAYEC